MMEPRRVGRCLTSDVRTAVPETLTPKKTPPVVFWGIAGGLFLALQLYVYGRWILGGHAKSTAVGATDPPTWMKFTIRGWEAAMVDALVAVMVFVVIRPWRRQGHPSFDGLFVLALLSIYWQDTFLNFSQVWYTYNSYFVNLGNWSSELPGWVSPGGGQVAEPLLGILPMYGTVIFAMCATGNIVMRWARRRWPTLSNAGLVALCVGFFIVFDFLCELFWMRLGLYSYPGSIKGWTVFHGHYYQFPIFVAVITGGWFAGLACVRYFRDDHGQSVVQRGLDRLRLSPRRKTFVSFLALSGALNTVWLITNVILQVPAMNADPWPDDIQRRSYLTNSVCGPGTSYACSGPEVPIPRPASAHVGPDGRLVRPGD